MNKYDIINLENKFLSIELIDFVIKGKNKYIKIYALTNQNLYVPKGYNDKKRFFESNNNLLYKYNEISSE